MNHNMKLWPDSFASIQKGTKGIEMRLNDEKRQRLKIGDIIEFQNTETKEILKCVVLNKKIFPSFKELYQAYDKIFIGYKADEVADYRDMYQYYPKKDIELNGALAIHLCKLEAITPKLLVDSGICPTCFNKENQNCLYGDLSDKLIYDDDKIEIFLAENPRAKGHTILSIKEHYKDMLCTPEDLVLYAYHFAHKTMKGIKEIYDCESVYLCTMCDGPMNHFHVQLIPRYFEEERGSKNFVKPRKEYLYEKEKLMQLQSFMKRSKL